MTLPIQPRLADAKANITRSRLVDALAPLADCNGPIAPKQIEVTNVKTLFFKLYPKFS